MESTESTGISVAVEAPRCPPRTVDPFFGTEAMAWSVGFGGATSRPRPWRPVFLTLRINCTKYLAASYLAASRRAYADWVCSWTDSELIRAAVEQHLCACWRIGWWSGGTAGGPWPRLAAA